MSIEDIPTWGLWGYVREAFTGLQTEVDNIEVGAPAEAPDVGIVYVAIDGSDGNSGRSWTLPKATIAGAQAAPGTKTRIMVGAGDYDIDESMELSDGQYIQGVGHHPTNGVVLRASVTLADDPIFVNTTGNLTSGGLSYLYLRGQNNGDGGVGIHIQNAGIADSYLMDYVRCQGFGSHGIYIDSDDAGEIAGNPFFMGVLEMYSCGLSGAGFGLYLGNPHSGTVRIAYLGGDNCVEGLLRIVTLNSNGRVLIDNLKAERATNGTMTNIVDVNATGGELAIGGFRLFHDVSGGVDGNALIRSNSTALRWSIDNVFHTTAGDQTYTWGFTDGTDNVAFDNDFITKTWIWKPEGIGLRHGTGVFVRKGTPEGNFTSAPGAIALDRTNGKAYIKGSGFGNTGWLELATVP